jgi:glyoxylase-like metal-dependent hydrolase (beta-lactamase superfamily II)
MKSTAILSLITATLLISTCNAEESKLSAVDYLKKAVADIERVINRKSVKETPKQTTSSKQEITSMGENKTIEEIIETATPKKAEAKTSDAFDYKLEPKKVAENVWCFFGAIEKPTKENAGNMANNCYIKTTEGFLVMDTGPSYQFAKQAYEAMQKIEDLPVKYVVNSHEHDDHWLGNDYYKQKFGATLMGPESINTNYKEGDKTRMYNVLPKNAIEGTHIIDLDKVVKKKETLVLGGEKFDIIPIDVKAHTGDDVFIYMPERKVLFAGDLVMNGRITSGRHGSVMGQLKALAMMQKLDWKILVPGHGFITDATAMDEANLYFKLTKERVLKAIDEGVDATEINEVVKLIEFKDKAMYDILNAQNIGFAFDELEMLDED